MMRRHGERLVGFSIALLFALAAPAGAQLQVVAQPTSAVAGANFLDEGLWGLPTVVTFDDGDLFGVCRPVTDYKVDVYWGDPTVAVPRPTTRLPAQAIYKRVNVAPGRCEYGARGNATYMKAGNFSYSVTVCRAGVPCAAATAAADNGARIAQARFTGTVLSTLSPDLSPTATQSFYGPIAVISDDNRYTSAADFQAHINWGEPSRSDPPPLILGGNGSFVVIGRHKYDRSGLQDVSVTVDRTNGTRRRRAGTRQADPTTTQVFGGKVMVADAPQPPPLCPDGRPQPCPPPPKPIEIKFPGNRHLDFIQKNGLGVEFRSVPLDLQYGIAVELLDSRNNPVTHTVLPLREHPNQTTVSSHWHFRRTTLCQLKAGASYALKVPARRGFLAEARQTFVFLRGAREKC